MTDHDVNSQLLRVLHVEDNAADAGLIEALLRDTWPNCRIRCVDSQGALARALDEDTFDLILSDFSLPGFGGLTALAMVRQRSLALPFIFISGTIGEDNAAEALRRGATDYVIKDRPARLIPAIRRALEEMAVHRQRLHAEAQLREQAELLDKARDAIVVSDPEGKITYWNDGAARIFGWTAVETLGCVYNALFDAAAVREIEAARQALADGDEWHGEVRLHTKAGAPLVMDSRITVIRAPSGHPRSQLIISTDITEQKQLEQQFLQAQRMESIGILAGGIAHDLNNALAPILMGLSLVREKTSDPGSRRLLEVMEKSAVHGASLVRQVLAFARGTPGERTSLALPAVIRDAVALLGETFPKTITVEMDLAPQLAQILADATQLSQVLMNLGINARDAMPEGGRLLFRALDTWVGRAQAERHGGIGEGAYVLVAVQDTGTGISPAIVDRIFDPFFTTKSAGKGTGLGLSTVRGIVKNHGGFMEVQSVLGEGTVFSLYFPALVAPATPRSEPASFVARGHGETILVIDDEANVREVVQELLEASGYRVLVAADGWAGIGLYTQERASIAAVVTDVMMPAMQGSEVMRRLRAINPAVRLVAMSGILGAQLDLVEEPGRLELLPKPMTSSSLLQALDRVLSAPT